MEILGAMDDQWRYCGESEDGSRYRYYLLYIMKAMLLPVSFQYAYTLTMSLGYTYLVGTHILTSSWLKDGFTLKAFEDAPAQPRSPKTSWLGRYFRACPPGNERGMEGGSQRRAPTLGYNGCNLDVVANYWHLAADTYFFSLPNEAHFRHSFHSYLPRAAC